MFTIQQYLGSSQMTFDIQSPLPEMRTISGHDSRRGHFINPRSSFYGDESYVHLLGLLFLWVDDALNKIHGTKIDTAYRFLLLKENLR